MISNVFGKPNMEPTTMCPTQTHSFAPIRTAIVSIMLLMIGGLAFAQPPQISEKAAQQMQSLRTIKTSRTATENKIDSRLHLGLLKRRNDERLSLLTDFRFVTPEADGLVPVDIIYSASSGMKDALALIVERRGVIKSNSFAARRTSARIHLEDMEALAALPSVRKIRQHIPAMTHGAINVSEGDLTHGASQARSFFGTNGAGQKICVLSDGVDSLASLQASGDLPAVDVLPGQAGSGDEGSAMLEIVHDLAPGADLGFATAITDEASFAQNILDLAADGCTVIVDDIIYLDESPFQDGPVAQSVNTVTAAGVLYFSSAGNEGNGTDGTSGTWEGDFLASAAADPAPLAGANLHDFGDGGNSILVEFGGGNPPLLIWAEHYDLATGTASTDFDIYDMDGALTTIFDASTDVQDGTGGDDFPIEFIGGGAFGGERLLVDRFAAGATSSVPMFNLILFRGELDDNLVTTGTTRGHSAAADAYSVAATPAAASFDGVTPDGPFPGLFTTANETESFSADGPRRLILSPAGAEITPGNRTSTGGVVRQKPDITAADGVLTASPGFTPFYGTSAAAPHAAAIAALIKASVPGITPAQVRTALISTALDIEAPGVDADTGAGIIMAQAAIQAAGGTPQAFISAGAAVPTQFAGDGDAFIEINESWNLTIPLTNAGGVGATAISAVLSSASPGVTVTSANSTYADLAPAASGNNATAYRFQVGAAATCGAAIDFTLTVSYTGGTSSPQTFPVRFVIGAPGTPATFSYTGPTLVIPDAADLTGTMPGAPVNADIAVTGVAANVYDVDVRIDGATCDAGIGSTTVGIDHTFVSDLEIVLRAPGGATALVIDETDGDGNNFCQTLLDDESAGASIQSVVAADAPFTGSFTPNASLNVFDGLAADGTWQLQAQDFFQFDTGNLRAYSVIVTPAVCDAPVTALVSATKAVSAGPYNPGDAVTYTVTLTNSGLGAQGDNPGDEFTDVLPANLTLVSATASAGTTVATVGTNTVTWNGAIAAAGSVTITISATINPAAAGQMVSNQGTVSYDGDANNTNEATALTDAPGGGVDEPTTITVGAGNAIVSGVKSVAGTYVEGTQVIYTIVLTNSGTGAQPDNAGNEFTDTLPAGLTVGTPTASSGTVSAAGANPVTWNGTIAAGGSVTITIPALINLGTGGSTISNQGTISFDGDVNGTNETTAVTDAPGGAANDATTFVVGVIIEVPSLSLYGLAMLALMLGLTGFIARRR
jgi:uncharacterized repeat protein (TIGR01451 family)